MNKNELAVTFMVKSVKLLGAVVVAQAVIAKLEKHYLNK